MSDIGRVDDLFNTIDTYERIKVVAQEKIDHTFETLSVVLAKRFPGEHFNFQDDTFIVKDYRDRSFLLEKLTGIHVRLYTETAVQNFPIKKIANLSRHIQVLYGQLRLGTGMKHLFILVDLRKERTS